MVIYFYKNLICLNDPITSLYFILPSIVLSQDNTNALLQELDQTIQNIAHYSNQRTQR
jgi:hypothetical protein